MISFHKRTIVTAKEEGEAEYVQKSGHNMSFEIEGWSNLVIVAPWCRVFHRTQQK